MDAPKSIFDFRVLPDAEFHALSPAGRTAYLKCAILAMSHLRLQLIAHAADSGE